jgi:hypothetical protein
VTHPGTSPEEQQNLLIPEGSTVRHNQHSGPDNRSSGCGEMSGADGAALRARHVVLATGPYQRPKVPATSGLLSAHIQQLHSLHYRRPSQLADGAVLVVGTGQSGAQIAEELHQAGREVHLAVSMCPSAPRRYRGRDLIWFDFGWVDMPVLDEWGYPRHVRGSPRTLGCTPSACAGCTPSPPRCSPEWGQRRVHRRAHREKG